MFDAIAWCYDLGNHLLSAGLDHRWRSRAAAAAGAAPGKTVLDVCCGTGDMALALLRRMGGRGRVIGCDFSRRMLGRARAKLAAAGLAGHATFLEAAAEAIPVADGAADAAVCAWGLRNLADPHRGLQEMVRVVRPGGRVVVLEFHRPAPGAFRLYFRRILPTLGRWLSATDAYAYLATSIEAFGPPEAMVRLLGAAGIAEVRVEPLPGGVAAVYAGRVKQRLHTPLSLDGRGMG